MLAAYKETQACHAGSAGHQSQVDHKVPSPLGSSRSGHSAAAAADFQGKGEAYKGQKPETGSLSVSRQRAEAAMTAAPPRQSTAAHPLHAGVPVDEDTRSPSLQPLPDMQEASPATSHFSRFPDQARGMDPWDKSSGSQALDEPAFVPQAAASEDSSAEASADVDRQASHGESELEAKLSELTYRLSVAEQAAGHHSQIQSQLTQLKGDKAALQEDLKQFMQHTSSMLTTIQAQMSRLMFPTADITAPASAEHIHASDASLRLNQDLPATALPARAPAEGSAEPSSPTTFAPARSSLHDWQLESHGSQPSPLARHEIFQRDASPRQALQQDPSSSNQPAEFGSWMAELQQGLGSRSKQVH